LLGDKSHMMISGTLRKLNTACICALLALSITACRPIYETRTPKFAEDVKKVVDPAELQKWAATIMAEQKSDKWELPKESVPASIRGLSSEGSPFQWASREQDCVRLVWGGGFGHWGVLVGSNSFRAPQDGTYYIEWKPGIYFWHETK
jgi:hypothetical protein